MTAFTVDWYGVARRPEREPVEGTLADAVAVARDPERMPPWARTYVVREDGKLVASGRVAPRFNP